MKCHKCQKVGHLATGYRYETVAVAQTISWKDRRAEVICFRCGKKGHYKNKCQEPKDQGKVNNQGKLGAGGNQDSDVMTTLCNRT